MEGVKYLPEEMRPIPSQTPHKIAKLTENSEEIRILYVKLLESIIFFNQNEDYSYNISNDDYRMFINDIVNITCTLCMDPCAAVILEACSLLKQICIKFNKELLFYFNSLLSRSVYLALTHKQSKLRIAAIDCLEKLLYCSPFKKNTEIMEQLIGFRDPNLVPIKDFYEPSTKLNYMALLISDPVPTVVKRFYEMVTTWMLELEDRSDHESRLIPYILTGLFDPNEEISLYVCERLELIGKKYEKDNEKDIIDDKQYGIDANWIKYTNGGKENYSLYYPFPLSKRPCLGSRLLIKKYLRRYIKNLCKEFDAIEESIRLRVCNLILFSIIYAEDGIIEYLDQIFLCFEREVIKTNTNKEIYETIVKSLKMIGRFIDYESITNLLFPTIKGDLNANHSEIQRGSLVCLKYIFQGHIDSVCNESYPYGIFGNKRLEDMIETIDTKKFIDYLDYKTALELIDFYSIIISSINSKKEIFKDVSLLVNSLNLIFNHIIFALGSINDININTDLLKKIEKILELINNDIVSILKFNNSDNSTELNIKLDSFFAFKIPETLLELAKYTKENSISNSNKNYKIFLTFLSLNKLFIKSNDNINLTIKIFINIFDNSFNFHIHKQLVKILIEFLNIQLVHDYIIVHINETIELFYTILKPYSDIEAENFKYVDLLKDEKELEKQKLKTARNAKSEIRERIQTFIKNIFSKNENFVIGVKSDDKTLHILKTNLDLFLNHIFNKTLIEEMSHESEKNRKIFIDLYYQFLVKYLAINKNLIQYNKSDNNIKCLINNFEIFFAEEIYDSILEVRQMCLTILNLILCSFPKSEFYEPMCSLFGQFNTGNRNEVDKYNFESLKVLAYTEEENRRLGLFFTNFKNIFSIVMSLYIDEKSFFGNLCDNALRLILERFPIFSFNEFIKAQNKNQISRIELLDKMFKKHLKVK